MAALLPFSREQFFEVFAAYNTETWLAAVAAYPLALLALAAAWRGGSNTGRIVGALLALMWGWVGFVYQGIYFSEINPVARVFAAAFVVQAVLFALHATAGRGLEFGARSRLRTASGALMAAYAMVAYPLLGLLAGETYPAMPLFGVAPCPLLVFTFGIMLWATTARWWLWLVPLAWSLVGGTGALLLSVPQDWALPVSAAFAVVISLYERRQRSSASRR